MNGAKHQRKNKSDTTTSTKIVVSKCFAFNLITSKKNSLSISCKAKNENICKT